MQNFEVCYLNVLDADAILLRYYSSSKIYTILIDAGNVEDSEKIKNFMKKHWRETTIDLAICTHPDSDHKGGFFGLLEDPEIKIEEIWLNTPGDVITDWLYRGIYPKKCKKTHCRECYAHPTEKDCPDLLTLAEQKRCIVKSAYAKDRHSTIPISVVGPSRDFYTRYALKILENNKRPRVQDNTKYEDGIDESASLTSSIDDEEDDLSPTNAGSIIILFEPDLNHRFLFFGDANRTAINDALQRNKYLSGCLIKVPHHGSKHNLSSTLIENLSPKLAVISAKGTVNHPSRGVVYCLSNYCDVYSTHKSGHLCYSEIIEAEPAQPLQKKR